MLDLYKEDEEKIVEIVEKVRARHMNGGAMTHDKLNYLHNELAGRLEDAGYVVSVDVTPLLVGHPPTVSVEGKQEPTLWDYEKKAYEVKKRDERKEDDPQIEGMI